MYKMQQHTLLIARLRKYDHISQTLKDLHWLPVEQRIVFKINLINT